MSNRGINEGHCYLRSGGDSDRLGLNLDKYDSKTFDYVKICKYMDNIR